MAALIGVALAVWLRTSSEDSGVLRRGTRVDLSFTAAVDPPLSSAMLEDGRHALIIVFGYTHCPDVCPTTLLAVHQVLLALGSRADSVIPIFITVDPERDTAPTLRAFAANFDPRIRVVSASQAASSAQHAFRAQAIRRPEGSAGEYSVDHTALLYVLDPEHRVLGAVPEAAPVDKVVKDTLAILARSR